ncbi:transporter [Phenylobacterium aquaticum]|uniref:transporter n=1 Tax=Phenylobacterium aquaticum TaxID=1763816 RepID=UPI001F5D1E8F|nr:transporter [Phenylobacterium aquaticum]MCI3133507.1 transporter [Phenylobacterium aquaticum]
MKTLMFAGVAALALSIASLAQAEDGRALCANRPGKGSPPCVLDQGRFQVEVSGVDYTRDRTAGVTTESTLIGDLGLRYGLTPTLEAELAWSPYVQSRQHGGGPSSRVSGAGDLTLAVRKSLLNPDGSGLSVAVQPFVTAPTGRSGIGADAWQGGVIVPVAISLSDTVGLGLTTELDVAANSNGHGTHAAGSFTAGLSKAVGPVSLGAELWTQVDDDPAGHTTQASFDLSAAWIPQGLPNLQLDIGANAGLNRKTPDLEAYFGLARRF